MHHPVSVVYKELSCLRVFCYYTGERTHLCHILHSFLKSETHSTYRHHFETLLSIVPATEAKMGHPCASSIEKGNDDAFFTSNTSVYMMRIVWIISWWLYGSVSWCLKSSFIDLPSWREEEEHSSIIDPLLCVVSTGTNSDYVKL
jgi:hypothetical protein